MRPHAAFAPRGHAEATEIGPAARRTVAVARRPKAARPVAAPVEPIAAVEVAPAAPGATAKIAVAPGLRPTAEAAVAAARARCGRRLRRRAAAVIAPAEIAAPGSGLWCGLRRSLALLRCRSLLLGSARARRAGAEILLREGGAEAGAEDQDGRGRAGEASRNRVVS